MKTRLIVLTSTLLAFPIQAGQVGPLVNFTAGTPAKASEVNANFDAVRSAVNDNDTRITVLESNITLGLSNTFLGIGAGNLTMTGNGNNTAVGVNAFLGNSSGGFNTASGASALRHNTTGNNNTATGASSLQNNTTGGLNTAIGTNALFSNTIGDDNTASGHQALFQNTTGSANTAGGVSALGSNTSGNNNTASGVSALGGNTAGNNNTATGADALVANATGSGNTAVGANALQASTGSNNIGIGIGALSGLASGSGNIAIGSSVATNLSSGSNNIYIGNIPTVGVVESDTIRIGSGQTHANIQGIYGGGAGTAALQVFVGQEGFLGTISSSRRFKDDVADMGAASDTLMKLRPVTFHYKSDKNPKGRTLQYGLVAEEVSQVAPGLVARSADGKTETVYYQFLAPMLVNEYQKQQRVIERQSAEIAELKRQTARLAEALARLDGRSALAGANP